jgi:hypothetical protein
MASPPPDDRMPRWVKVSAVVGGLLTLMIVIILLLGHGPGRHIAGMPNSSPEFLAADS